MEEQEEEEGLMIIIKKSPPKCAPHVHEHMMPAAPASTVRRKAGK